MGTVVIAGGTGLLGTALFEAFRLDGHRVVVLTRHPAREHGVRWSPGQTDSSWAPMLSGATAVINLAGTSIAGRRWTAARKAAIRAESHAGHERARASHRGGDATTRGVHQQFGSWLLRCARRRARN